MQTEQQNLDNDRYVVEMGPSGSISIQDDANKDILELTALAAYELLDYLYQRREQLHRLVHGLPEEESK